jgi:hypothetical protein
MDEFHPKYARLDNTIIHLLIALLRYLLKGMSLYQEDDHQRLTTDPTIYTPSSDGRLRAHRAQWNCNIPSAERG